MTTTVKPAPAPAAPTAPPTVVHPIATLRRGDVGRVGGKGANLGELLAAGLPIPPAVVVDIDGYSQFCASNEIGHRIATILGRLAPDDPAALQRDATELQQLIVDADMPATLRAQVAEAYHMLRDGDADVAVAVRSSATAEDTAQYSFAGMFESYLNVLGEGAVIEAVKKCWASTFGARTLFYRAKQRLPLDMPVAVVIQQMVRSDKAGVMFTCDPATRDTTRLVIEAAWGLGESVVQGSVTPDRYVVSRATLEVLETAIAQKEFLLNAVPEKGGIVRVDLANDPRGRARVLTAAEVHALATFGVAAEAHYGVPQDLEFAIAGTQLWITQSRPITTLGALVHGLGAAPGRASGTVRILESPAQEAQMQRDEVLVTRMTSPDWVPIMRRASAIVTDAGGMTSHAAIVARELGLPCVVGAANATSLLQTGMVVTVDGTAGTVVRGAVSPAPVAAQPTSAGPSRTALARPVTATRLYVNLGEPSRAEEVSALDVDGVGLLRAEFMMLEALEQLHPREFLARHGGEEFVRRMATGLRAFASAFAPRPVVYRTMDFRSNEFRHLTGGEQHEPTEANPMIGYRGCFRYIKEPDLFALELRAIAEVRKDWPNLHLMLPFVRTARELEACLALVNASELKLDATLERWVMAEVPSVIFRIADYAKLGITGVSIGSNDLTQLMLGVDRDSALFGAGYDERDAAVLDAIRRIIEGAHAHGLSCSICGQAPSIHAEYAETLIRWGIDSISVNVDAIDRTRRNIAAAEQRVLLEAARSRSASAGVDQASSR